MAGYGASIKNGSNELRKMVRKRVGRSGGVPGAGGSTRHGGERLEVLAAGKARNPPGELELSFIKKSPVKKGS
jgi:hypothetical protein